MHPFYVVDRGFVLAGELGVGTQIVTRAGPTLTVAATERRDKSADPVTVYNLTVDGDHTYFVGGVDGGAWVHNDCTSIARDLVEEHGGSVYRLSNPSGMPILRTTRPLGAVNRPWYYHDVQVGPSGVRDPMLLGHNEPIPFEQWQRHFQYFEYHTFGPAPL